MNIYEATQKAIESGQCISREEWRKAVKIRPTDSSGNCILMMWDGSKPSKHGWQPRAEDLIAQDWEIGE